MTLEELEAAIEGFIEDGVAYLGWPTDPLKKVLSYITDRFEVLTAGGISLLKVTTDGVTTAISIVTNSISAASANITSLIANAANITAATIGVLTSTTINVGTLNAQVKNFKIQHPTKLGKFLVHGALEGPEYAVYIRGEMEGSTVYYPDYWSGLIDPNSITIHITPIGYPAKLCVTDRWYGGFSVRGEDNHFPHFYYEVKARRMDVPPLQIEIDQ
jgi:hypothetical protein